MLRALRRHRCPPPSRWAIPRRHGHVVCLGEPMLRIAPMGGEGIDTCSVTATGSELLTACAVSRLGQDASLVTALPDSHLAAPVEAAVAAAGVSLKALYDRDPLTGITTVHLPPAGAPASGGSQRTQAVLQGAPSSAFVRECSDTAFCWPTLLRGVDVLHTSTSTLALGPGVQGAWQAAVVASPASVAISVEVDQCASYRHQGGEEERREYRDTWARSIVDLAEAGRLSLLTLSARDLDGVCSAVGVTRSGSTSSAQLMEQVEALALQLRRLRRDPTGGESLDPGPLVAVQFATNVESAEGVGNGRLRQKATRWSTVAVAHGGSDTPGLGSTRTRSATTEHVPVKYSYLDCETVEGGQAAFVGGLLSALLEQGRQHADKTTVLAESQLLLHSLPQANEISLQAMIRRGDITAGYAELVAGGTNRSNNAHCSNPAELVSRRRVTQIEHDFADSPARLDVTLDGQEVVSRRSSASDGDGTAATVHGKGILTGSTHLPGFGGGSDLNALNPLMPGAPVSSLGDPLAMLRGFGAVAETVGLFSAGAAGAGLSKGLRDLDKIRTSLAAVATSLNVSEQALLNALTNAVPELAKYVPLLSMLPGGGGVSTSNGSMFADTRAVPAPKVAPSTVGSQQRTAVADHTSSASTVSNTSHEGDAALIDGGQSGQGQTQHVASADDEMEKVWRTESVSHAISRSRLLLPVAMPVDLKRLTELREAGVTAVVLTAPVHGHTEESISSAATSEVVEEGRRLGLCVGVETQTTDEMAAAAQAGARFVLVTDGCTTTSGNTQAIGVGATDTAEAGGVQGLLSEAARLACMRRMPVIPVVRDSVALDKLVSQFGIATVLWECNSESGTGEGSTPETPGPVSLLAEIEEFHRDYGGTLRFIVGCNDATAAGSIVSIVSESGSHSAAAAVLGARPSWLVGVDSSSGSDSGDAAAEGDVLISAAVSLLPR